MKFSLHYSILLVAATVACVAAAPTTTGPDAIVPENFLSVAHRLQVESNKLDQEKAVIAQKKTVAEKDLEAAKALADKLGREAATARETVDGYALSIGQLTEVDNKISQKKQALADCLSACVSDLDCSITSIVGDNIEEPVDEINTAEDETDEDETDEDEIDPTLTGSDPNQVKEDKVKEDKVEEGQVDKDKTGTDDGKAKTADDNDAEDIVDDLEVNKKAAKENDSKMKVGKEEESEMEVGATKITEQETPEDKAAERKRLEEIAAEKEKKEKRVKDAAREAAEKKAEEVAKEEKASEKVNKIKKDKAAKKDEEAEVVAEEGEATKKGEMKGEDKTVQEEKAGENDETKGVDKTVQEEKAGESGEKKGEDKTKNAVVQDSGAKFNQPAVAVGILSVMFALAFGV